ncbi:hypothetical protein O7635_04335 [Asanoa sp. WMMD1127]|uniref:hypothetical protein n=1 Tax=Asanoa sp. WMMD1127 TaxID=3016107 RepID=UPI0024174B9C|nr:hypothetical protein [Asanoa sp. WMMD1127]MDG4821082.1 hypothetical protein [Asanoa sp. WMMD1127]
MSVRRPGVLLAGLLLAAAGCSGDRDAAPPPTCSSPVHSELQGTGSLWALFFPRPGQTAPVVAGEETKIVWKIGGTGDFTIAATGPDGATAELVWGPTGHGASTWERPGTEYGTGFLFPRAGCWTVTAERTSGERGELFLTVA